MEQDDVDSDEDHDRPNHYRDRDRDDYDGDYHDVRDYHNDDYHRSDHRQNDYRDDDSTHDYCENDHRRNSHGNDERDSHRDDHYLVHLVYLVHFVGRCDTDIFGIGYGRKRDDDPEPVFGDSNDRTSFDRDDERFDHVGLGSSGRDESFDQLDADPAKRR